MKNPVILALDVPTPDAALELARQTAHAVGAFKIGKELFVSGGPDVVRRVRETGAPIFLDLKFHDIPNTVAHAIAAAVRHDVEFLTVHALGGRAMMAAAEEAAQRTALQSGRNAPLVLGVTILTSHDTAALAEIGLEPNVAKNVERLAALAVESGLRGLVCSPLEIARLRQILPEHVKLVAPGIRPEGAATDDQKRTLTPLQALQAGADWIVIGRPIYAAPNPRQAAEQILASLQPG